jgi:hypothetical protein
VSVSPLKMDLAWPNTTRFDAPALLMDAHKNGFRELG